ncbi:MAG TPA: AAA family ATPase [Saprospiraceae bacterium]|nr:AAA family ATPase [Saprospiraceae bacterium]
MKILKLRFKNIHSLRGEHEIDFTISPFTESGLFAITGPTGAGKSTILDVITLALFSRIPRFDGKITNTEIEKVGSVMTHFTEDAYAEIDYQTRNKYYRSTWNIAKTSKGKLKDYNMMLSVFEDELMINGTYIGDKKSTVPVENEGIIGLNYDQFVRSILLSQGEFAKFLKSDKTERAKLLEDITGSQIYRIIGKKVFEKAKAKREEIALTSRDIQSITSLTLDVIEDKKQQIKDNQLKVESNKISVAASTLTLNLLQKKVELELKLENLIAEQKKIVTAKNDFGPKEEMWTKHQKISIYRDDIISLTKESQRLENIHKDKIILTQNIENQKLEIQKLINDISTFTKQSIHQENITVVLRKFEQTVLQLENSLNKLTEEGKKQRNKINALCASNQNSYTNTIVNTKSVDDQLNFVNASLNKIGDNGFSDFDDALLRSKMSECQTEIDTLKQKYTDATKKEEAQEGLKNLSLEIQKSNEKKEELEKQLKALSDELKILEDQLIALKKKKEEDIKITSLEVHRNTLVDGEPCPLCGAVDHPYAHEKLVQIGLAEIELNEKNILKEEKSIVHTNLVAQIAAINERVILHSNQIEANNTIIHQIDQKWQIIDNKQFTIKYIHENITTEQNKLEAFAKEVNDRRDKLFLTACIEILKEISDITKQYKDTKSEKETIYQGSDVSGDVLKYEQKYQAAKEMLWSYQTKLTNLIETEAELTKYVVGAKEILLPNLLTLGYQNILDAQKDIIDEVKIQAILKEKDELTKSETQNETNITSTRLELGEIKITENEALTIDELKLKITKQVAENDEIMTTNGIILGELEQDGKNKLKIAEIEELIKTKEAENKKWTILDNLIGDAQGNNFSKFAQNLSLKHLITLANKRLEKLTDRYLLASSDIESDLTIIDLYQGNVERSVKTLSGGESFIVSLAMALSLSDMASKNVKLESLFIDEGFGSLDADTLETALETLEKLQAESNRMIGVISHVESMKERISTQIRVKKSNQGYSEIVIKA